MGVQGLWDILLTAAESGELSQLSGLVVAVDISIWLVRAMSADLQLKTIFDRIVKLRKHNILPIIVFDGVAPTLKRNTLSARRSTLFKRTNDQVKKYAEIQVTHTLLRQLNALNQVVKVLEGKKTPQDKHKKYQEKIDQIKNIISTMQTVSQEIISLQKIQMQANILNLKYSFLIEDQEGYLSLEQFQSMDIQSKVQYLNTLPSDKKSHLDLSSQDRLRRQLKQIEKRTAIRQMQDNLYRKLMKNSVRIENGYEIIQSIYNGKRVIQKKKIQKKQKKVKNNYSFQFNTPQCQDSPDEFLNQFCSSKCPAPKQMQEDSIIFPYKPPREQQSYDDQLLQNVRIVTSDCHDTTNYTSSTRDNLPQIKMSVPLTLMSSTGSDLEKLLTLCGIPFIVAPAEAQAQCASLQLHAVVDAVITDDSDVFLFGATNVFRGVFQNKIKHYSMHKINTVLHLNREKMIILALLLGSDYTEGVKGVGIVNAMEIVKVFDCVEKLQTLKMWGKHADILLEDQMKTKTIVEKCNEKQKEFFLLHQKYKNYWFIKEEFPNKTVIQAYLSPEVINNSKIQLLKQNKHFQQKEISQKQIKLILQKDFLMNHKQIQNNIKILKSPFIRQNKTNRGDSNNFLAQIRSKRLKKAIQ